MSMLSGSGSPVGAGLGSWSGPQSGAEVLLLDSDARVRSGFRKLLATADVIVTATDDHEHALSMASEKHFAVAVLDLDTPQTDAGFELMAELKRRSPATEVVLLAARQTFAVAVSAFRQGASDVISKSPDNVNYLTQVVVQLCNKSNLEKSSAHLLARVWDVHEDFLKRLMDASRRAAQAEERVASGGKEPDESNECVILVVDDNPVTMQGLQLALPTESGFQLVGLQTGGEALDYVGQHGFQLALVKNGLPDLPSSMVAKSVRAETTEGIVLLFSHPLEGRPGRADIIETTQSIELIPELTSGEQLIEQIHELRTAYVAKSRERRYLQQFRRDHYDFLRRYVELRQAIAAHLPEQRNPAIDDDDD